MFPTKRGYVLPVILGTHSNYFPKSFNRLVFVTQKLYAVKYKLNL